MLCITLILIFYPLQYDVSSHFFLTMLSKYFFTYSIYDINIIHNIIFYLHSNSYQGKYINSYGSLVKYYYRRQLLFTIQCPLHLLFDRLCRLQLEPPVVNQWKPCKNLYQLIFSRRGVTAARDSLHQGPGLRAIVCLNSRRHCATSRHSFFLFLSLYFSLCRLCVYLFPYGEKEDSRSPSGTFVRSFSLLLFSFFLR